MGEWAVADDWQGVWHLLEVRKGGGAAESVCFFMLYYHGCEYHLRVDGLENL